MGTAEEYLREELTNNLSKLRETLTGMQDEVRKLATTDAESVKDEQLPSVCGLAKQALDQASWLNLSVLLLNVTAHEHEAKEA